MGDLHALRGLISDAGSVLTAFSGGVDSAFLAWVAHDVLGPERAFAVTAVSASLAPTERDHCRRLAALWRLNWSEVLTDELARPAYVANGGDRCYHCKAELMERLAPLAARTGSVIALGVNLDDLGDHRPGQQAAAERAARFPLVEAGFTKAEIRRAARRLGLEVWDRPAAPCLASRLPYGTPVTLGRLDSVGRAEEALKALGFSDLRVRHYGDLARIEFAALELDEGFNRRREVISAVKAAGYRYVALDLEGLRSGNLNEALAR